MKAPVCVVPALIWPSTGMEPHLTQTALPALSSLLAGAPTDEAPAQALEVWLAAQFGIAERAPLALMRLAGETDFLAETPELDSTAVWLCADPVAMTFSRDNLLLSEAAGLDVSAEDARALLADLNATFADVGRFYAASPTRWYLRVAPGFGGTDDVIFAPLTDVAGRPVAYFQPEGPDVTRWARLSNELQVFCYNHPVNAAREASGRAPLNAMWLWGNGHLPAHALRAPAADIAGQALMLRGLLRLAGSTATTPGPQVAWQLADALAAPAQLRQGDAWLAALAALDRELFQPYAEALADGRIEALTLIAPAEHATVTWHVRRRPRWQFWHRPLSAAALAATLTRPDRRTAP
ncbi:MAG: hypothetical protein QM639_01435 [Rhodocyclaceae bacterium]